MERDKYASIIQQELDRLSVNLIIIATGGTSYLEVLKQ